MITFLSIMFWCIPVLAAIAVTVKWVWDTFGEKSTFLSPIVNHHRLHLNNIPFISISKKIEGPIQDRNICCTAGARAI